MKTLQVGELKAKFSKIIEDVKNGEEVTISYGRKQEKVAVIIPYSKYNKRNKGIKIGLLEGKATYKFHKDFKLTEEEFLNL
jgi:prevent-host-death family protein